MLTTVYSVLFAGLCVLVAGLSVLRPLIGLTFLVAVTPFYSILRESSVGSPVFFLWPYLLTGVLVLVITVRELTRVLESRGVARPRRLVALATTGFLVAAIVIEEIWIGAVSLILADADLSSTRILLGNGPMGVATVVLTAGAVLFFGLFLKVMHEREGRVLPLDLVMVAFVGWGVFQILNTYDRNGLLFTGLNGFRYYYFAAMTYFPARYLLRTEFDRGRLITVLGVVALLAGLELFGENVLLNAAAGEPSSLPWASGHLSAEFGYTPDTERTFFEGRYIPLGFMYQTHMSGLFVALGFGLWLPLALTAQNRPMLVGAAFALLFLMINSIWTSRTVLLLVGAASVLAVALGRAGWRRSLVVLVALAVAAPVTSAFLIPGVRYDLQGEISFLRGRALPSLMRAIGQDLEQVIGWNPMLTLSRSAGYTPERPRPPVGWQLTSGDLRYNDATIREHPTSVVLYPSGGGAELRFALSDVRPLAGRVLTVEAWVWAEGENQVRVQVHDGTRGRFSNYHAGARAWERVAIELELADEPSQFLVDVDVEGDKAVYVDSVRLVLDEAEVLLLGGNPDVAPDASPPPLPPPDAPPPGTPMPVETVPTVADSGRPVWLAALLGRGASFGDWNVVFFGDADAERRFRAASYSDMKVLEFGEQFGVVGVLLLLTTGVLGLWLAGRTSWAAADPTTRARYVGAFLVVFIGYVALMHLPSLFRLGISTAVFAMLGLVASAAAERPDEGGATT